MHINSICAKETQDPRTTKPHVLPLYPTSSFEFESIDEGIDIFSQKKQGHVYSRYGNPTVEAVAHKLAQLETAGLELDARALLFSSGQAAVATMVTALLQGWSGSWRTGPRCWSIPSAFCWT